MSKYVVYADGVGFLDKECDYNDNPFFTPTLCTAKWFYDKCDALSVIKTLTTSFNFEFNILKLVDFDNKNIIGK